MDQLILVEIIDVFSLSIVIEIANHSDRNGNSMLAKPIVVDNTDELQTRVSIVNKPHSLLANIFSKLRDWSANGWSAH